MKNRGWMILIVLCIIFCIIFFNIKMNEVNRRISVILEEQTQTTRKINDMANKYSYGSVAKMVYDQESSIKRLESNLKQVVESCGKYWKYY